MLLFNTLYKLFQNKYQNNIIYKKDLVNYKNIFLIKIIDQC